MPTKPSAPTPDLIELCRPWVTTEDREAVSAAIADGKLAFGPVVREFESRIAEICDQAEGVAVASGTAALHLALLAAGVQPGDQVLMPSLTFVAPANAARYVSAEPLLLDSEPDFRQLDIERLGEWLASECEPDETGAIYKASRRRISAIIAVDLLGHPCDIDAVREAVKPFGIAVIEDAAQAFGGRLRTRPLGAAADALCVSFNANKLITCGGGGMVLSNDRELIERVRFLANQAKDEGREYVHPEVGFNYRLPTAQAALGLSQLERLPEVLERKRRIAERYREQLAGLPGIKLPEMAEWASATEWLFTVQVHEADFGMGSRRLAAELEVRGVETRPIFMAQHMRGVHQGREVHPCLVAEELALTGLSLPSSVSLQEGELARVSAAVIELGEGSRLGDV
jgi:perosamine synthetase